MISSFAFSFALLGACAGASKDGLFVDAPLDAGAEGATIAASAGGDAAPQAARDAAIIVDAHVLDAFATSCVPREGTDGAARCRGSSECALGEVCCAAGSDPSFGATIGKCSHEACDDEDEIQLCTATCECLHGACQNAWPYEVHGTCR